MRGRKATPPHLRLLRGDARHQQRDGGGSQLPLPPEPLPPSGFLSDRAKGVWTSWQPSCIASAG
jgi:hypothetical protein